jgi:hypothetical protein
VCAYRWKGFSIVITFARGSSITLLPSTQSEQLYRKTTAPPPTSHQRNKKPIQHSSERNMKLSVAVLLVVLLSQRPVAAFVPNHQSLGQSRRLLSATLGMAVDNKVVDVSIPYDAAARLAYDQWRADFNKGDFDATRFQIFKDNYEIITVANVKAKKKARDDSTVSLSSYLMSMNEFGDMTQEEYEMLMMGVPLPPPAQPYVEQQYDDPSIGAPPPPPAQYDDYPSIDDALPPAQADEQYVEYEVDPSIGAPPPSAQSDEQYVEYDVDPSIGAPPPSAQSDEQYVEYDIDPSIGVPPPLPAPSDVQYDDYPSIDAPPPSAQSDAAYVEYDDYPSVGAPPPLPAQSDDEQFVEYDDYPSIGAPPPPPTAQPTLTSDMLGKAFEAVELQTEASNALEEAFDALAEEEQVRCIALKGIALIGSMNPDELLFHSFSTL